LAFPAARPHVHADDRSRGGGAWHVRMRSTVTATSLPFCEARSFAGTARERSANSARRRAAA